MVKEESLQVEIKSSWSLKVGTFRKLLFRESSRRLGVKMFGLFGNGGKW